MSYPKCENCGSEELTPKHSSEDGVYTCQCDDCGHRAEYEYPEDPA